MTTPQTQEKRREAHVQALWSIWKHECQSGAPLASGELYDKFLAYLDQHEPKVAQAIREGR